MRNSVRALAYDCVVCAGRRIVYRGIDGLWHALGENAPVHTTDCPCGAVSRFLKCVREGMLVCHLEEVLPAPTHSPTGDAAYAVVSK